VNILALYELSHILCSGVCPPSDCFTMRHANNGFDVISTSCHHGSRGTRVSKMTPVFTGRVYAREHGPRTRVVCTELKFQLHPPLVKSNVCNYAKTRRRYFCLFAFLLWFLRSNLPRAVVRLSRQPLRYTVTGNGAGHPYCSAEVDSAFYPPWDDKLSRPVGFLAE